MPIGAEFGDGISRVPLAFGVDGVLEVENHGVRAAGDGLGESVRSVAGHIKPREHHTTPLARRPLICSAVKPISPSTASVSAPCGRPAKRTLPGVADSRNGTFCIRIGPRSGSSIVTAVPSAAY